MPSPPPHVIIVGAGVAGMTSGHLLHERGVSFEILEAAETPGGRLKKTEALADFPIDLGAEWLHTWIGARPAVLTSVLDNDDPEFENLRYQPQTIAHWRRGELSRRDWLRHVMPRRDRKFVASTWFDVVERRILPDIDPHLRLGEVVHTIDRTGERVLVETHSGRHEADKVIVTVPVRILQDGDIEFVPPLPDAAVAEVAKEKMTPGLKVFMEFSERFYPDMVIVGGMVVAMLTADHAFYDATLGKKTDRHVLGLYASGEAAAEYTPEADDDAIRNAVLARLDEMFDGAATRHHIRSVVQNWTAEPFIRGTHSRHSSRLDRHLRRVDDRLFFAGEAINKRSHTIAVHGAAESAELTVEAVVQSLASPT